MSVFIAECDKCGCNHLTMDLDSDGEGDDTSYICMDCGHTGVPYLAEAFDSMLDDNWKEAKE